MLNIYKALTITDTAGEVGEYRIIGIVENGITKIIKIAKRDENTYKGL